MATNKLSTQMATNCKNTNDNKLNTEMATNKKVNMKNILYKDLSYKLQGIFFKIKNELGGGYKEPIYRKALEKELEKNKIMFQKEYPIKVFSKDGEFLGLYRPDFVVEDKIIVEIKTKNFLSRQERIVIYDYLKNSKYQVGYLVNFGSKKFYVRRYIYTND
ncbi:MAG: GxxExxY protein [Minisyncoccia bacterium]